MSESTGGRKRPAPPRSRGKSPPIQRRRQSEQFSAADRYRQRSVGDAFHDHDRSQSAANPRRRDTDHSPMVVTPSTESHSGSTTPVQVAPTVPYMLPLAQKPIPRKSSPMDTLKALRSQKALRAASKPEKTNSSTTEVKALNAKLIAAEITSTKLMSDLKQLSIRVETLVQQQQQAAATSSMLTDFANRLSALENAKSAVKTSDFVQLQVDVQATKDDFNNLQTTVAQDRKDVGEQLRQLQSESSISVSGQSKSQEALQREHNKLSQANLFNEHSTLAKQVNELRIEQEMWAKQQQTLQDECIGLSDERKAFREDLQSLKSQTKNAENLGPRIENSITEQAKISNRVTQLETAQNLAANSYQNVGSSRINDNHIAPSSSEMEDVQKRLRSVEDRIGGDGGLSDVVREHQDVIEEMDKNLHRLGNDIASISEDSRTIFDEVFDPFKASVHEQLSVMQDLQDSIKAEVKQHSAAAIVELREQVAKKQDIVTGTQAIDTVKAAVRTLQSQYDNISTEDLHQKMVHWFMQHHPPANLLQQFAAVQHEVAQLRGFTDITTRVPNAVQTLGALAQMGPQITALVRSPPNSGTSAELNAVKELVTGVRTSLTQSVDELRAELNTKLKTEHDARTKLMNEASWEHDERLRAEGLIEASLKNLTTAVDKIPGEYAVARKDIEATSDRLGKLVTSEIKSVTDQVQELQTTMNGIRPDFDQMIAAFRDPVNRELLAILPTLFEHTGQITWVVKTLNQNLPKGPLRILWSCDWEKLFEGIQQPFPSGNGEATGNRGFRRA
ncbi:hypothetical protein C7974DRAFT_385648 [Boeremia exigua]|uniref:uncharacterized protein n=1 Tax=Boeremia exigua TaxID=749465 RepID=UPI001E8D9077|nr:uncharacterized protein C7974DRAFT_385648 [Boeremia exigua]KAH6642552.1 hypothetical protein C7974DRAFT_385648 [Boeremia exigua]